MDDRVIVIHLLHFILSQLGHVLPIIVLIQLKVIIRHVLFLTLATGCLATHLFALLFFKHFLGWAVKNVAFHLLFTKLRWVYFYLLHSHRRCAGLAAEGLEESEKVDGTYAVPVELLNGDSLADSDLRRCRCYLLLGIDFTLLVLIQRPNPTDIIRVASAIIVLIKLTTLAATSLFLFTISFLLFGVLRRLLLLLFLSSGLELL